MLKYPNITVKLTGGSGNAMAIVAKVQAALRKGKVPGTEIDAFVSDALSGNYDHVLRTALNWVDVA